MKPTLLFLILFVFQLSVIGQIVVNNDGPFNVNTGGSVSGNVLINDSDTEGNVISVASIPVLPHGSFLSFNLVTGDFEYQAPVDVAGIFNFIYTVTNGTATAEGTVTIRINDNISPEIIANEVFQFETGADVCEAIVDIIFATADNCSGNGNIAFNGHALGGLQGWTITQNGGDGFITGGGWFTTSYNRAAKHQIIDLRAQGYDAATLDAAPDITVSENYIGTWPRYDDTYFLNVELRDADGRLIQRYSSGDLTCSSTINTVTKTFSGYGEGVRYIFVQHGGDDREFWAGFYGARMTNLQVLVNSPVIPNLPVRQTGGIKLTDKFPVGTTRNTYTVMDMSGNTASAGIDVFVKEPVPPVVKTKDITVQLNPEGTAVITAEMVNDNSTDNCGIASMQLSQTSFDCSHTGTNEVTLTITDLSNNISTGTAIITVVDVVPPAARSRNISILLDENGTATILPQDVDDGSEDACGIELLSLSKTTFTCDDIGVNEVILTVTDPGNNSSTVTANVTVADLMPPAARALNISIVLDENNTATILPQDVDDASTDACGIESLSLSKTTFTCDDLGANEVTLTVTDIYGNVATATSIVTVVDQESPVIDCRPLTVYLGPAGNYRLSRQNIETIVRAGEEGSPSDNCTPYDQLEINVSQVNFSCEHASTQVPVTISVTDASGNIATCETTIWVIDPHAPKALCKDKTIYLDVNGSASVDVADLDAGTTDACGIDKMWLSKYNFDCTNIGENPVTLFAKDIHGNWSSCISAVHVADTIAPSIHPVSDVQFVAAAGVTETMVAYPEIQADDNCEVSFMLLEGIGPDGHFPIGTTTETWQISDASGNLATTSFTVTVKSENSVPFVANPVTDHWIGANQTLKVPLAWKTIFHDADQEELACEVNQENEGTPVPWAELSHDTLFFFPANHDSGCVRISLRATDTSGAFAIHMFNVCVEKSAVNAGTINLTDFNVNVYPNPADDKVNIELIPAGTHNIELKMTDMSGKLVLHKQYRPGDNVSVDVSDKLPGLYLIHLNIDDRMFTKKIIVQ